MIINTEAIVLEESATYLDQDGLWKRIITDMFEPFILFFAPDLHEILNWRKKPASLEQELLRAFPEKKGTWVYNELALTFHVCPHVTINIYH